MDADIGLDLDIDEYELTNSSYQQSSAPTSELGDAGSPNPSLLNEDLTQTNNINIILKQCNTTNSTSTLLSSPFNSFNQPGVRTGFETKLFANYSKRGPGRPRKENPLLLYRGPNSKFQPKKKLSKDLLNSSLSDVTSMGMPDENNKPVTTGVHFDELPYFTEKYPGKMCCLCNLCERSSLGQGDLLKITVNAETFKTIFTTSSENVKDLNDEIEEPADTSGRKKNLTKQRVTINNELVNELDNIGHDEVPSWSNLLDDGTFVYMHSMCAMWSVQLKRIEEDFVPNVEEMIAKSLTRKCSYCQRYGASIGCRMSCTTNFHLPCAAAASCFLIIESFSVFCSEHISQVPYISIDANIECRQCSTLGDISKLLMCCTCGAHYHTTCIGLANFPDSRSGWNCTQCCKCLICRQTENSDGRSVKCEQCQKIYHTTCLRPIISSVPKYGWKCNRCRVCSDCGARTPGAGASSRWHCHYTICDSCYQQRNKGFSCPICHKAYRAASHKEMVKCSNCNKFVHSTCDDEADLAIYHLKKETNPDYDYVCPSCKMITMNGKHLLGSSSNSAIDPLLQSTDSFGRDLEWEFYDKDNTEFGHLVDPLKISKKRIGLKEFGRGGKMSKLLVGKSGLMSQINRKRSARGKGRQFLITNPSSVTNGSDLNSSQGSEEDVALEKKMILCSAKDKFILMQDVCVMCGSLGTDHEACLIACVQCGQCYHPHCANVTVSKTMLQKGWRCLDCTVCEGCGQKNDEGRLILCDECDISYHIYCMSPPLDAVPNGNWKCKWCAICQKCGRNSPGKNSSWFNGFLECGPCASQVNCFACSQAYNENDLIIQCTSCERWLHCQCDSIKNEEEAKLFNEIEYHCMVCRSKNNSAKSIPTKILLSDIGAVKGAQTLNSQNKDGAGVAEGNAASSNTSAHPNADTFESTDNTFWLDGVCVSEHGLNMIRSLTTEIKRKRKVRTDAAAQRDLAALNAGDAAAGNSTPTPGDAGGDGKSTPIEKITTPTYKDGMVWFGEDGSQPEGFSISTNEEGLNILRKKRQRNLQKLGIGGFNVRMRGFRKENDEQYAVQGENVLLTEVEKKKKIIRKKLKSKLSESYPAYLQEAFFGKNLLDNKESSADFEESDSSENAILGNFKDREDLAEQSQQKEQLQLPLDNQSIKETKIQQDNIKQKIQSELSKPLGINIKTENIVRRTLVGSSALLEDSLQISKNVETVVTNAIGSLENPKFSNDNYIMQQQNELTAIATIKTEPGDVMLSQSLAPSERLVSADPAELPMPIVPEEPVKETVAAGTQKTAEKMRKDEDLGEMATISAVLYANTQHPELKHMYPNWNERCKQILKIWRSLSTEMKAPFLQHAKDNRSVLRLRRSQQEPEKVYFQQKSLKEQEQERAWKQHQAKSKETYTNKFAKNAFIGDYSRSELTTPLVNKQEQALFDMNILTNNTQKLADTLMSNDESTMHGSSGSLTQQVNHQVLHSAADSNKTLSQLDHQAQFVSTLIQNVTQTQDSTLENFAKAMDNSKPEGGLQLAERSDIFIADKNWSAMPKISEAKDPSGGIDKLESDENAGLGDILGGFGEGDDDEILKSLTAEIGDDFNILEYADPELDELNGSQNLLSKLDFDETQKTI
uniref:Histone-lysine N-methyltransferase n=1 Tax=Glossina austeni TaxID=7395 RepID=A0A1A9UJ12_GLOAU